MGVRGKERQERRRAGEYGSRGHDQHAVSMLESNQLPMTHRDMVANGRQTWEGLTYEVCIRRQRSQADKAYCCNKCASCCVQSTTSTETC